MENYRLHLTAIFKAIGAAQTFTAGMDFEAFVDDDKTASAVVQKLEIVGEAVKSPRHDSAKIPTRAVATDGRQGRLTQPRIL